MNKYFKKDLNIITTQEYNHIFAINPKLEPLHYKFEDFEYWIIKDVLIRPEEANKFILDNYAIIERESENNASHHPNKQLVYPEFSFYNIKEWLMRFVSENDILNFPIINYQDQKIRIDIDNSWHTYSNLAYKNVKIQNRNHEPHTDGFTLGCNLFLTHNGVGTSLFKKKYNDELIISDIEGFTKYGQEYIDHMSRYYRIRAEDDTIIDGWINIEDDSNWKRYHIIPGEFNTISMYRGTYFHSPFISNDLEENEIRHNLVFGYCSQSNEEEDQHYNNEVKKWNYFKKNT
jgi:hypothetical protein